MAYELASDTYYGLSVVTTKEYLVIEQDLVATKYRIEHANLYNLI